MERFGQTVNAEMPLTIAAKCSILDVRLDLRFFDTPLYSCLYYFMQIL